MRAWRAQHRRRHQSRSAIDHLACTPHQATSSCVAATGWWAFWPARCGPRARPAPRRRQRPRAAHSARWPRGRPWRVSGVRGGAAPDRAAPQSLPSPKPRIGAGGTWCPLGRGPHTHPEIPKAARGAPTGLPARAPPPPPPAAAAAAPHYHFSPVPRRLLAAGGPAWAAAAQPAPGSHAPHLRAGPAAQRPVRPASGAVCAGLARRLAAAVAARAGRRARQQAGAPQPRHLSSASPALPGAGKPPACRLPPLPARPKFQTGSPAVLLPPLRRAALSRATTPSAWLSSRRWRASAALTRWMPWWRPRSVAGHTPPVLHASRAQLAADRRGWHLRQPSSTRHRTTHAHPRAL